MAITQDLGYQYAKSDIIRLLNMAEDPDFAASINISIDGHLAVVTIKTEELMSDILV